MQTQLLALAIGGLTLSAGAFAQDKAQDGNKDTVVREIDVKGLRFKSYKSQVTHVRLLITAETFPKVITDMEDQTLLKKQVDFTKQQLILFAWWSTGDDKLTYTVENGGNSVIFSYDAGSAKYKPGTEKNKETNTEKKKLTWQLRAFAIPKNASWLTPGWPYFVDPGTIPKLSSPR